MIKKNTPPWIAGLIAAGLWFFLSTLFYLVLPEEWLLSHVLRSWVNLVSFYLAGAVIGFIYERQQRLSNEAKWKDGALLPQWTHLSHYDQIAGYAEKLSATELSKRPNRLLSAVYVALGREWSPQVGQEALDAKYKVIDKETTIRYRVWYVLTGSITTAGFFGTMLGASQAIPHIEDLGQIRRLLHVAFDTTLVALSLGLVVGCLLTVLRAYDERVLLSVYDTIFDNLIQAIKQPEDVRNGKVAPSVTRSPPLARLKPGVIPPTVKSIDKQ
jgi:hypothetical protein